MLLRSRDRVLSEATRHLPEQFRIPTRCLFYERNEEAGPIDRGGGARFLGISVRPGGSWEVSIACSRTGVIIYPGSSESPHTVYHMDAMKRLT